MLCVYSAIAPFALIRCGCPLARPTGAGSNSGLGERSAVPFDDHFFFLEWSREGGVVVGVRRGEPSCS